MLRKALAWLLDVSAQQLVAAVLGSAAVTAVVSAVGRLAVTPSWEVALALWTTTAFASYVALAKTAHRWLPSAKGATPDAMHLNYDPKDPKRFSPKSVEEFFDLAYSGDKKNRDLERAFGPHIGLWLVVEGAIHDIVDDQGDDGEGGRWATVTIEYDTPGKQMLEFPRPVQLWFFGADANVIRALNTGDRIKAHGRIRACPQVLGAFVLMPAELVEYPGGLTTDRAS